MTSRHARTRSTASAMHRRTSASARRSIAAAARAVTQVNLRVAKGFALGRGMRIEAIAEVFNLFNAKNPSASDRRRSSGSRLRSARTADDDNPNFLQPTTYAGDFQEPEQRVGQIGFRVVF